MSYSNGLLSDQSYQTIIKYTQRGLPGFGFKLTDTGDYDMQNKKLINAKAGINDTDVTNKGQLDYKTALLTGSRVGDVVNNKAVIYSNTGAVHARSLYLLDDPQDGNSNEVRIETQHQSHGNIHLYVPDLQNFDGFGGRLKSDLMITSVAQTVTGEKTFENIIVHNPVNDNQATNKGYVVSQTNTKLSLTGGTMTGDIILQKHTYPIAGNTNKVINYEAIREIFLSRKENSQMDVDLNMNNHLIQNVKDPVNLDDGVNKKYVDDEITKIQPTDTSPFLKLDGTRPMTGNLDMDNHLIQKAGEPFKSDDVATKNYVDTEIGFISIPFLKLDGTRPMTGNLNMDGHKISNLKMPEFYTDAANKQYIDTSPFLKLDGTRPMTGDLDMDSHKITNLNLPTDDNDASNKQYIDEKLLKSHLLSSKVENAFKYLSEVDESATISDIYIHGVVDFNGSPHKNKKAYDIDMVYSLGVQNYTSKLGINLFPLAVTGKYTLIMEYYFSSDNTNINIIAESTKTTIIKKQTTFDETNYKKFLVQFDFPSKANPPHYLYFTISGTGITSTNPEGYLVFYGVKGWDDAVPSEIYDHTLETGMFEYNDGDMKMNHDIDMNNHRIKNIPPPTNPTDLLMKQSLEIHNMYIFGLVNNRGFLTSNNFNLKIKNIYIKKFIFYGGSTYANTQDHLFVNFGIGGPLWRYPFRFDPNNQATEINIDKYFNIIMNNFRLSSANQIEFELQYSPLSIKSTKI